MAGIPIARHVFWPTPKRGERSWRYGLQAIIVGNAIWFATTTSTRSTSRSKPISLASSLRMATYSRSIIGSRLNFRPKTAICCLLYVMNWFQAALLPNANGEVLQNGARKPPSLKRGMNGPLALPPLRSAATLPTVAVTRSASRSERRTAKGRHGHGGAHHHQPRPSLPDARTGGAVARPLPGVYCQHQCPDARH